MTKILAIGDLHFKTSNIPEVELFIEKILDLANKLKPDIIVVLGDILDTHEKIHAIPLNKATYFFESIKKIAYTIILVGNHDMYNNQQFLSENHWMNSFKKWDNISIIDKTVEYKHNNQLFVFTPYVYPGRFIEALNTVENWKDARCIFAHQEFRGCKMGAITSLEGDVWDLSYPLVISGHIHSKDKLQDNIYYTGSAMQHAFGESDKNVVVDITFTDSDFIYNEIDLNLPRKKTIYKSLKTIHEFSPEISQDKIMISIEGNYEEFKSFKKSRKYKELCESGVKIKFNQNKLSANSGEPVKTSSNFKEILQSLVYTEPDNYLIAVYENIVYDRNVTHSDILFLSI